MVGIYSYPVTLTDNQYALGANQIFIPSKSVVENKLNILENGPMQGYNTSFRIKNGSIDHFMEKMNQIPENEFLRFQFYDNGYEQLVFGLQGTKLIAVVLFFAGLALLIGIIVFILYFMVIKQKRRIAIERALGTSKANCTTSLLSGILFLTISSLVIGVVTGDVLATKIQSMAVSGIEQFDKDYTIGIDTNSIDMVNLEINNNRIIIYEGLTIAGGTVFIIVLSLYLILRSFREAPINLLGRRDD